MKRWPFDGISGSNVWMLESGYIEDPWLFGFAWSLALKQSDDWQLCNQTPITADTHVWRFYSYQIYFSWTPHT